jgi:hypothetical protein
MRFIIFVIDGPGNPASANEMMHIDAFNEKLQMNNNWITAAGIAGAPRTKLIDNRADKNEIISGTLVTGDQNYSGFWLIEAESEEAATDLALEGSKACNRRVELRPYL